MNLLIDSGNTRTKVAICSNGSFKELKTIESIDEIKDLLKKFPVTHAIIASVNKDYNTFNEVLNGIHTLHLSADLKLPLQIIYKTPKTLGVDRIAAVIGSTILFPRKNCLVIDAGTCITYDLVTSNNTYLGGSISPGIDMRFKALNTFTAKLPLVERKDVFDQIGDTTENAIISGVLSGVLMEMKGIIRFYREQYAEIEVIITGGDANFFDSKIKDSIFVEPNLLFIGLNRILEYNV